MRLTTATLAALVAISPAMASAQDNAADQQDGTIAFDPEAEAAMADDDWGIAAFQAEQQDAQAEPCRTQSDIIVISGSQAPRYDDNGALIRTPAAACGSRYGALGAAARAELAARDARGESEASASYAGRRDAGVTVENQSSGGCTEDRLTGTRTCTSSGTISIGNSPEAHERARTAAQEAIDRLRED